jgi:hypothetical protein
VVKPSTRYGGGRGVFARRNISNGTVFCTYTGYLVDEEVALNGHFNTDYVIEGVNSKGEAFYLDARRVECLGLGKYVNDIIDDDLVQAKVVCIGIELDTTCKSIISLSVKAYDDIEEGEEIYISYGRVYWMSRLPFIQDPQLVASILEEFA